MKLAALILRSAREGLLLLFVFSEEEEALLLL
jgi:hypothetical protein